MDIKCVLTADIRRSKNIKKDARIKIQKQIFTLLDFLKMSYKEDVYSVSMTTGDEFQIVLNHLSQSYNYYKKVKKYLNINMYMGLGFGDLEIVEERNIPSEMYGTAFYNSRNAINISKNKNIDVVFSTGFKDVDFILNTLIQLILFMKNKWTKRQKEILSYLEKNNDILQKEVATHFKVSEPLISKIIKTSGYDLIQQGESLINVLLDKLELQRGIFKTINFAELRNST